MEEFFIQYPLKLFRELRSLALSSIRSNAELSIVVDQLPALPYLTSLYISLHLFKSDLTADELQHTYVTILRCCVTLRRLDFTIWDDLDIRKRTHNKPLFTQPIVTQIEHLRFYQIFIEEFDCILSPSSFPQVKSLFARVYYRPKQMSFSNEGLALHFLTNLELDFHWGPELASFESILKRTPNLKTLMIASSPVTLIDCQKWQYFSSKYLLKLVKLHLHVYDWEDRQWSTTNEYMDFQTSTYWLTERGGIVQTECKQVWDEEGSEIDSIFITFRTMAFKNCQMTCSYCLRY